MNVSNNNHTNDCVDLQSVTFFASSRIRNSDFLCYRLPLRVAATRVRTCWSGWDTLLSDQRSRPRIETHRAVAKKNLQKQRMILSKTITLKIFFYMYFIRVTFS